MTSNKGLKRTAKEITDHSRSLEDNHLWQFGRFFDHVHSPPPSMGDRSRPHPLVERTGLFSTHPVTSPRSLWPICELLLPRRRSPRRSFRACPVPLRPDIAASAGASAGPRSPRFSAMRGRLCAVRQRKIDGNMSAAIDPEGEKENCAFEESPHRRDAIGCEPWIR
jgi:hypothetical protein